jgi:peptide/nickel transport system substrate-binding protein
MAWSADFPDPSDFYGPILSCASAVKGGWNWSWYCNKTLEKQAEAADSLADPAKAAERAELWRKIFITLMDDAPWVPVFNETRYTIHTARIGGPDAIFVDPVHTPVNFDYVYAKDVQ